VKYRIATLSVYNGEINAHMDSRKGKGEVLTGICHEDPEEE
jgi:hypothetical protein